MLTFEKIRKPVLALSAAALLGTTSLAVLSTVPLPVQATAVPAGGYVDLVARVSPAVVTILVEKQSPQQLMGNGMPQNFPFEEFARRFGFPMPGMPNSRDGGVMLGTGTGFVVTSDGQIVTNAHVVGGADKVTVKFEDGRKFDAKIVGVDDATDIAVVKIDAKGLPTLSFGDSSALKVGESVVAIGNPFGLGNTVTTGIVSALGRDINAGPFDNFIQTDAAINKGNSGGPLLNEAGEVVGINTAIFSPTGGSVGIGFSVPSDLAKTVVADLADDGTVERGYLGVRIGPVSEEVATALGLGEASGTMVMAVDNGTPAAKAGLTKGDIILKVDGKPVANPRDLTRLIAGDAPGIKVVLHLLRAGKAIDVSVILGNRAEKAA